MNRQEFITASAGTIALSALPIAAYAKESAVTLHTPTGDIFGTVTTPAKTAKAAPVVLIIAGSGPVNRDGNVPPQLAGDTYKLLAERLAERGIASVRYDKRGIAASQAAMTSEANLRFTDYVTDAASWVTMLSQLGRFSRVVIAGHSEGSLVGMVAAQSSPAAAFVSLEGAGRPAGAVLREQLKPKLPPDVYAQCDAVIASLEAGKTDDNIPQGLGALFRTSVQPYLISWMKYDPATEIAKLSIPVTIVQGTADIQVTMIDANALVKGAHHAKLVTVSGMNHVLKYAPDTSSIEAVLAGYSNATLPIEPLVVETVAAAAG